MQTFPDHGGPVNEVSFSPDNKLLASAGENDWQKDPNGSNNTVKLWDLEGNEQGTFKGHDGPVTSVNFSADGNTIASGSADNTIRLWSLQRPTVVTTIKPKETTDALSVDFSPDGSVLATQRSDHKIERFDLNHDTHQTLGYDDNFFTNVALSANGITFAMDKNTKSIMVWNAEGKQIDTLIGHRGDIALFAVRSRRQKSGFGAQRQHSWLVGCRY